MEGGVQCSGGVRRKRRRSKKKRRMVLGFQKIPLRFCELFDVRNQASIGQKTSKEGGGKRLNNSLCYSISKAIQDKDSRAVSTTKL